MYLYLTSRSEPDRQLIEAECMAITGAIPDKNGIAIAFDPSPAYAGILKLEADVSRAAYIKFCVKVIIHASELTNLYNQLEKSNLSSERFRVSVVKFPNNLPIDSKQVMREVGARIAGKPNLSNPETVFLVIATEGDIWMGEVMSKSSRSWEEHSQKIHQYSSSLPARFARALINLAAVPGDRIIDPCCGSGTILIEAASIGVKAVGCDINPKMASASAENLKYFDLSSMVLIADARNIKGNFDAVVTDLPYGRNCPSDEKTCYEILKNLICLAPKAVIVAGEDISQLLFQIGYKIIRVITIPKSSLARRIYIGDTKAYNHP